MCRCSCSSHKCEAEAVKIIRNVSRVHCISVETEVAPSSGEDDNARAPPSGPVIRSRLVCWGGMMLDWTTNTKSSRRRRVCTEIWRGSLCALEVWLNVYMCIYACMCLCICITLLWYIYSLTHFRYNTKNGTAVSYVNLVLHFFKNIS